MQLLFEVSARPLVDHEHCFALGLRLFFLIGEFLFLYVDMVFSGQVSQGLRVTQLLVLHDEVDGTAAFTTSKTFADALGPGDIE